MLFLGYLIKQVLKKTDWSECDKCKNSLQNHEQKKSSITELVDMKTEGGLIYPNMHFFSLIHFVEKSFSKHCKDSNVFDLTVDEVLNNYEFKFPCKVHGSDILAYAIFYYIRLRMRQFTYQENLKIKKVASKERKMAKLRNN